MYHASDKAQKAAEVQWYATHSLPSAVNAGCRVLLEEIVAKLRAPQSLDDDVLYPHHSLVDAAEFIEREFGGKKR